MSEQNNEVLKGIAAQIEELQKSIVTGDKTEKKVDALGAQFDAFQKEKNREARKGRSHKMFGDQASYDVVANVMSKALVSANKLEASKQVEWLAKANADLNQTDSGQGATFLPTTIDTVVGKLVEDNGILRQRARVVVGVKGTFALKNRNVLVTVAGVTRPDGDIPLGGSTYTPINLNTHEVGLLTTVEEKLIFESPVDLIQEAMSDLAEAAALFEDTCLFAGDGTAADVSFTGLNSATTGVGGANQTVAYGSFAVDDCLNVRTKVHTSVFGKGVYYMHPYVFAALQTKKASTAGSYFFDISSGTFKLGGSDIVFAPRMDSTIAANKIPVIYGDLSKAITAGIGRDYQIRVLTERYADEGQVGIRMVYDLGIALRHSTAVAKVALTS